MPDEGANEILPALERDGDFLMGDIQLPAWESVENKWGRANSGGGTTELAIESEVSDTPSPEQIRALEHLIRNDQLYLGAVLEGVWGVYSRLLEEQGLDIDERENMGLNVKSANELTSLMTLTQLYIRPTHVHGESFVGFEFDVAWDQDHRLLVMTHKGRVLRVGMPTGTYLNWPA